MHVEYICVGVHDGPMMNAYAVEMSPMKFTVLIREYLVCNKALSYVILSVGLFIIL